MTNRREFIGAGVALLAAARAGAQSSEGKNVATAAKPLNILFLGGTGFIGPHQIERALVRGHNVTMFNRGNNSGLFGDRVEEIVGNRDVTIDAGLKPLTGSRRWDVVVDNSGYVPQHVQDSVQLLKDRTDLYLYISTRAVYDETKGTVFMPDSPLWLSGKAPDGSTYGPLKAECDRIVRREFGDRAACVRPPYIVGPGDTTDRFTYWVERLYRGGDVVCPPDPDHEVQWIDARDLAEFVVTLAENRTGGIFNCAGPASVMDNEMLMHAMRAFSAAPTTLHWPTRKMLADADFNPLMFGSREESIHVDTTTAVAAGLKYRPLVTTVQDTHNWWWQQSAERRANARRWPSAETERAVLRQIRNA